MTCRACRSCAGQVVLDLGEQPPCDGFPPAADPGPDPRFPLRMWLCGGCGLAQLGSGPEPPVAEVLGTEPAALREQAAAAVAAAAQAGYLSDAATVAEFGSPHGGTWLGLLSDRGLSAVPGPADVVVDCFGLMHAADQAEGMAERAARVAPGGTLLLQYHSLGTIIRLGQWNALRHGHYAYYSLPALTALLARAGFAPQQAWRFDLYGGTIMLACTRGGSPGPTVRAVLAEDEAAGVRDPQALLRLRQDAAGQAAALRAYLTARRGSVFGYGAASRTVALLTLGSIDNALLPAIADASPAKHGRRMPGTGIPIISPGELIDADPAEVVLFLPDLLPEVRAAYPQLAGRWRACPPQ